MEDTTKNHNTIVFILTVICICVLAESLALGWELWVPPIVVVGIIAAWWLHIFQFGQSSGRESFYLTIAMLVSYFHGVHKTGFFDAIGIFALFMGMATLLGHVWYLYAILTEYLLVLGIQVAMAVKAGDEVLSVRGICRLSISIIAMAGLSYALKTVIENGLKDKNEIKRQEAELNKTSRDMEDFLVNLSHELRTPVNVINGLTDIILRKDDREDINSIHAAGERLSRHIEDVQDYSEILRNHVVLENERYMITAVLNDILTSGGYLNKNEKIKFIVDLDPAVPAVMKGDIRKLSKVMVHLLDNAFKFTKKGMVKLGITALKKKYGVNLIIEVSDTGIGMTDRDIEGVAEGLYQANKERNRSTGGIGLGLSIVYGLIRSMDGFVKIESEKGKGTTVRVSVCQEVIDPSHCLGLPADLKGEEKKKLSFNGIRALVVDDESLNLAVAKGLFREYDMEIDTASSGRQAIDMFAGFDYDVIFLDHMMPEMDGIETMKKLKNLADQRALDVKMIALTANAVSGAKEMFISEGFDGFISKPISVKNFERVMSLVVAGRKGGTP